MTAADRKVVWHDHGQWPQLSVFVPDAGRCVVLQKKTNFRPKLHSTSNPLPTSVLARASFNEPGCVSESCSHFWPKVNYFSLLSKSNGLDVQDDRCRRRRRRGPLEWC